MTVEIRTAIGLTFLIVISACGRSGQDREPGSSVGDLPKKSPLQVGGAAPPSTRFSPQNAVIASSPGPNSLVRFELTEIARGLVHPWSIAFLPSGDALITERSGRLRLMRQGQLETAPITGVPVVRDGGEGGLLDIVIHPEFDGNGTLFLSMAIASDDGLAGTIAVVRARLKGRELTDVKRIFVAKAWAKSKLHYGGRMAFDGAGKLLLSVGDRFEQAVLRSSASHPSQDLGRHDGKILRLNLEGGAPADNPFVGRAGALVEIWSYGHLNSEGLVLDSVTGDVWETEHGPMGGDELNVIIPGQNYGWPVIGFGRAYGAFSRPAIHVGTQQAGMEAPSFFWSPSIAPSGLMLYSGKSFPEWRGNLFVGGLLAQHVERVTVRGHTVISVETMWSGIGRVRDIKQGPEGDIYILTDDRQGGPSGIWRVTPRMDQSQPNGR